MKRGFDLEGNFFDKKGQVTLFMLLGLGMLLLVVIGYIIYSQFVLDDSTDVIIEATTPQTPLQTFIQQCIATQTRDGIERLGEQGGYIDVPTEFKQSRTLAISPHPSREYIIPYWVNKNQVLIPTIEDMELELSEYVSRTLPFCLNNFAILGETNEITKISDPVARVSINRNDVVVDVSFSVSRSSQALSQSFERFIYKEPVELRETIQTAGEFAKQLSQSTFLEDMTVDLMSISDPKIPMSNIRFRCDPQIWLESRVQKELEEILYYNVPSIRVRGAELTPFEAPESVYNELEQIRVDDFKNGLPYDPSEIPSDTYEHAHMYYNSGQAKALFENNIKIGARYLPEYGMEFVVRPSTNGKLEGSIGQGVSEYLQFLCVQVYHFTYDVAYPIEFIFQKESAFQDGSPFILRFATSVNIDHNLPDKGPLQYSRATQIGDYQSKTQLCEGLSDSTTTIIASDVNSALDVHGVSVNYICDRYVCPLGDTSLFNGRALLRTNLPNTCFGAKLQFVKDGYITKELNVLDGVDNALTTYQADLTPLIDVQYKVVLGQNEASIIPTELKDTQYAVLLIDDQFSDFETYATLDDQTRPVLTLPDVGSLYNITVLVYDDEDLVGGYIGQLSTSQQQLRQQLILYTYDFIRLEGDDAMSKAWLFLQNDEVYRQYHMPKWQ